MKKTMLVAVVATMFALAALTGVQAAEKKLSLGLAVSENSQFYAGAVEFARLVKEKTGGAIEIEIFANAVLGSDRDHAEGLTMGSLDFTISGTSNMNQYLPKMQVLSMPFLYRDKAHAIKVCDSEIGQTFLKQLEPFGLIGLSLWENGMRNLTTRTGPIAKLEDIKGMKIRTQESPVQIAFFRACQTDPTPMAFSEVYTALQQGTVDGQENPISIIYTSKLHEVNPYITITQHVYEPAVCLMSKITMDSLTPDQQKAIREAAVEAGVYEREQCNILDAKYLELMEKDGAKVNRSPDRSGFAKAAAAVHKEMGEKMGVLDIIEKIKAM